MIGPEAMHVLLGHEWRGNVRELENLIERVVAFSTEGPVTDAEVRGWLHRPATQSAATGDAAGFDRRGVGP